MADVIFLAVVVAFFALAALFVTACQRIIESGEQAAPVPVDEPGRRAA